MASASSGFTFHRCLGEGGNGEVYLCTQITEGGLRRDVAVKVLHERYDPSSDATARLRDEGQLMALLAHPNIVAVHGFNQIDGRLALITEYVEGADVARFCNPDDRMPREVALEITRDIALALEHALSVVNPKTGQPLELVHRDIKPANMRLSVDGVVKLLDFGVARSDQMDRKAQTALGSVLFTDGYAAPEALGSGMRTPSIDMFALGATLFAMLTGIHFYQGRDLRKQVQLSLDRDAYERFHSDRMELIDPDLREVVSGLLVHDHKTRTTATEAADLLDGFLQGRRDITLKGWLRQQDWGEPPSIEADLVGVSFDMSGRRVGGASSSTPTPADASPERRPPEPFERPRPPEPFETRRDEKPALKPSQMPTLIQPVNQVVSPVRAAPSSSSSSTITRVLMVVAAICILAFCFFLGLGGAVALMVALN